MGKKLGSVLAITPGVVCSFQSQGAAKELIQEYADRYPYHGWGSAWAVELRYHIQKLVDSGEEARARQCLQDCYSQGISAEWWHEMRLAYGER